MRHFMVDPDNEERLLKVPRHVVDAIQQEVRQEIVDRATIHLALHGWHPDDPAWVQRFRAAL